jgi:hypothetical protein
LGRAPRASCNAAFAPDAQGRLYENYAVFGPFLDGAGWANMSAERHFTVKARKEVKIHPQSIVADARADLYDSTQPRPNGEVVLHLAVKFATVASDASLRVMEQILARGLPHSLEFQYVMGRLNHRRLQR